MPRRTATVTEIDNTPISHEERREFEALYDVVEKGLSNFMEVGKALMRIRDGRLYRESWKSFDAFIEDCFGMTRAWAHAQIAAFAVTEKVSTRVDTFIPNEATARQFATIKDDDVLESVARRACEIADRKRSVLTPAIVKEAKVEIIGESPRRRAAQAADDVEVIDNRVHPQRIEQIRETVASQRIAAPIFTRLGVDKESASVDELVLVLFELNEMLTGQLTQQVASATNAVATMKARTRGGN